MGNSKKKKSLPSSSGSDAQSALIRLKAISNIVNGCSDITSPTQGNISSSSSGVGDSLRNDAALTDSFVAPKSALDCLEFKIKESTSREISNVNLSLSSKLGNFEQKVTERFSQMNDHIAQTKMSILLWVFGIVFSFSVTVLSLVYNSRDSIQQKVLSEIQPCFDNIKSELASSTSSLIEMKLPKYLHNFSSVGSFSSQTASETMSLQSY